RRRQTIEDLLLDRHVVLVAVAEVEVQNEALHVVPVLLVPGVVELEVVANLLDELRVWLSPRSKPRRVGRGKDIEDDEGDEAHQDEQQDHPEQPADDVTDHCSLLPQASLVRDYRGPGACTPGPRSIHLALLASPTSTS